MAPKRKISKPPEAESSGDYDAIDHVLQGGTFLLTVVQEAAKYAPVPYLQEAAGSVLLIFNTIAATKNNKEDLERLAEDAVKLMAAIWTSYKISENKHEWPSRALREIILGLVKELDSITAFVKARVSKPWAIRAVYNVFDAKKIVEYRQRLNSAVQNFQVSSDLNVNDMLLQVLRKQDEVLRHVQATNPAARNATHPASPQVEYHSQSDSGPRIPTFVLAETGSASHEGTSVAYDTRTSRAEWEDPPIRRQSRPQPSPMTFNNIKGSGISIGGGAVHVANK